MYSGDVTDVGLLILTGGRVLNGKSLNHYKKLGPNTNKKRVLDAFKSMAENNLGQIEGDNFIYEANIIEKSRTSNDIKIFLLTQGLSHSMFEDALSKEVWEEKKEEEKTVPAEPEKKDVNDPLNTLASTSNSLADELPNLDISAEDFMI